MFLLAAVSLVVAAKVKKTSIKKLQPNTLPLSTHDRDEQVLQMGKPHVLQVLQKRRVGIMQA
jgi:hypothetical protein